MNGHSIKLATIEALQTIMPIMSQKFFQHCGFVILVSLHGKINNCWHPLFPANRGSFPGAH